LTPTSIEGITIPGAIDAWCRLAAKHGSKPLEEIFKPAIDAAENGFRITHASLLTGRAIARGSKAIRRRRTNTCRVVPRLRLVTGAASPHLGRTLHRIAREGRAAFYEGEVAEELTGILQALGGVHTVADFAANRRKTSHRFPQNTAVMMCSNVHRTGRDWRR
jgi:gamma-glutamyltranspeptidase/glutathione hydrolase